MAMFGSRKLRDFCVAAAAYVEMRNICRAISVAILHQDNLDETLPNVFSQRSQAISCNNYELTSSPVSKQEPWCFSL